MTSLPYLIRNKPLPPVMETTVDTLVNADAVAAAMTSSSTLTEAAGNGRIAHPDSQCAHIVDLWKNRELKASVMRKYKSIAIWAFERYRDHEPSKKKRKLSHPKCSACSTILSRPAVCLRCDYAGCLNERHIQDHLQSSSHLLYVDAKSGAVFCSECDDIVYSEILDELHMTSIATSNSQLIRYRDPKKSRELYSNWVPTEAEAEAIQTEAYPVSCEGRRGLLNLGQTCALNTVLQSFLHNPLLRNYFLSDKHNSKLSSLSDGPKYKLCKSKECMCCEMDRLFSEVFSGDQTPYAPIAFLPLLWRSSGSTLSEGYAQHDAHEVLVTCLSLIHANSRGSTNISCNCVIHSTFSGSLASEVKCGKNSCGYSSVKIDPMMDISLQLKEGSATPESLNDCLERFIQPETLQPREYTCTKCGSNSGATKSMSIKKLPPILGFQLKRFGHKTSDKSTATKINIPIRFPAVLNMLPYTSAGSVGQKDTGPEAIYLYELFCVINHEGAMDTGHYTNFARYAEEWYRFDDDKVTHATLSQVLRSTAYILFYVKRDLDYEPESRPSYVKAREAAILQEQQKEKEKELRLTREIDEELMSML